jgi:hypothetical protein
MDTTTKRLADIMQRLGKPTVQPQTITLLCPGMQMPIIGVEPQRISVAASQTGRLHVTVTRMRVSRTMTPRRHSAASSAEPPIASAAAQQSQGQRLTLVNRCAHLMGDFGELLLSLAGTAVRIGRAHEDGTCVSTP